MEISVNEIQIILELHLIKKVEYYPKLSRILNREPALLEKLISRKIGRVYKLCSFYFAQAYWPSTKTTFAVSFSSIMWNSKGLLLYNVFQK